MNNLVKDNASDISAAYRKIRALQQTKKLIASLPKEIQDIEGYAGVAYWNATNAQWTLSISIWMGGEESLRQLKAIGFTGLKHTYTEPLESWSAIGSIIVNEIKVSVHIYGLDMPNKCHLEPYEEMVTKYRMVCEEDSEDGVVVG